MQSNTESQSLVLVSTFFLCTPESNEFKKNSVFFSVKIRFIVFTVDPAEPPQSGKSTMCGRRSALSGKNETFMAVHTEVAGRLETKT